MTRKQLYEIFEDVEQHRIYCKEQFADAILALISEIKVTTKRDAGGYEHNPYDLSARGGFMRQTHNRL